MLIMVEEMKRERGRPTTPSTIVKRLKDMEEGPERARAFFEIYFGEQWRLRSLKTGRKLDHGVSSTLEECTRLKKLYPAEFDKILENRGSSSDPLIKKQEGSEPSV